MKYHNIHVVYTKEAETADQYIEKDSPQDRKKSSCDSCYIRCAGTGDHSGARRSAYVCFGIERGSGSLRFWKFEENILEKQKMTETICLII